MRVLREIFPERLIFNRGTLPWPAQSLDLVPSDFSLLGYLITLVYNNYPRTFKALKNNICYAIGLIQVDMLEQVDQTFRNRLQKCSVVN